MTLFQVALQSLHHSAVVVIIVVTIIALCRHTEMQGTGILSKKQSVGGLNGSGTTCGGSKQVTFQAGALLRLYAPSIGIFGPTELLQHFIICYYYYLMHTVYPRSIM